MNDVTVTPGWLGTLKAAAFALHMIPTQLALGAAVVAGLAALLRTDHATRLARRTSAIVPPAAALAIALGVPALMFNQIAYPPDMDRATVAQGWAWYAIIPVLLLAYAAAHELAVRCSEGGPGRVGRIAGVAAAVALLSASRIFTNLTAAMDISPIAGSRWAIWLGLALMTTGAWLFDDAGRAGDEPVLWRGWAAARARTLHLAGLILFAIAGARIVAALPGDSVRSAAAGDPLVAALFALGLMLPLAVQATMRLTLRRPLADFAPWRPGSTGPGLVLGLQAGALLANAGAREWARFIDIAPTPVIVPRDLLLGILGLATLGAILTTRTLIRIASPRQPAPT